nr:hypothetical protein [Tanacetum cinerariifolium]
MIESLMYVTSSRPDIMFATCMCARYQANPNEHHVSAVKRIFSYLKGTINLGLWYPKDSGFDLTAYSDADHAGCHLDRKTESEYVVVFSCCAQVLWMRTQLMDYGFFYDKVSIYCDLKIAIAISCNPVQHTHTKHIDVRIRIDLPRSLPSLLGKLGLGLDEKQLPPSDLIIPMPVHGARLNLLINLLPEFGGTFPSTPPHQNQPTPREVEETQRITRDEQTQRKQEGPTEITKSSPLQGKNVLLADDDPSQHLISPKLLSRNGLTTTCCINNGK